jgi:hypothetical protein
MQVYAEKCRQVKSRQISAGKWRYLQAYAGQAKAVRYLQSGQAPCRLIFICPGFGRPPGSRTLSGRTANLKSGRRPAGPLRNTASFPEFQNSIDPCPPLPTLRTQFLLISTPKFIRHLTCIQDRARSSYLGVDLGGNHQGGRACAHDVASMGASAAGIVRCHW